MSPRPITSRMLPPRSIAPRPSLSRNSLSPRNGILPWVLDGLALVFAVAIVAGALLAPQIA